MQLGPPDFFEVSFPITTHRGLPSLGWCWVFPALLAFAVPSARAQWANSGGAGDNMSGDSRLPVPMTVSDAVFRSRWIGMQVDSNQRRSSAAGMLGLGAEPGPLAPLESIANTIRDGLKLGPLDIHPGLAIGWEYDNVNTNYQATGPSSNTSAFIAPSLAFRYNREISNWSVNAAYGGGFTYYLDPNFTSAGAENQRNPFYNTATLGIGYLGPRQKIDLQASGSYGTGFNILSGQNTTTADMNANLRWEYILTTYATLGAHANYSTSLNNFFQTSNTGSNTADLGSISGGAYADWLATGKTRLRFELSAGQESQGMSDQDSTAMRNYTQGLLSLNYQFTEKFDVSLGLGARYVQDPKTVDPKYVGLLPSYTFNISYRPTEKTGVSAGVSQVGNNIQPNFNLTAFWQPRVNTGLSLSIYQGQGFSYTVSEQVQVTRGAVVSLTEKLFSKVDVGLSGGWQQAENLSLSGNGTASQESGTTSSYGFATFSVQWNLSNWASWQNQLYFATGNNNTTSAGDTPETRITTSFNLMF